MRFFSLFVVVFLAHPLFGEFKFKEVSKDAGATLDFAEKDPKERLDIFVLGDSITCGEMGYSTDPKILKARADARYQHAWALDLYPTKDNPKVLTSLFERVGSQYPLQLTNAAWPLAYVDNASKNLLVTTSRFAGIKHFTDQLKRMKSQKTLPNLVLIAGFHNNLDFDYDMKTISALKDTNVDDYLKTLPEAIANEYKKELKDLFKIYSDKKIKASFVVFGYINLKAGLEARDKAGELHKNDKKEFPSYEVANERFKSTLPPINRPKMLALAEAVNDQLKKTIEALNDELKKEGRANQLQVVFSRAMSDADLSDPRDLHPDDAFHPSSQGHNKVAAAVEKDLADSVKFLAVKPR